MINLFRYYLLFQLYYIYIHFFSPLRFVSRSEGKKNHRLSLRPTRRQLYESRPPVFLSLTNTHTYIHTHTPCFPSISFSLSFLNSHLLSPHIKTRASSSARRRRYYLFRKLTPRRLYVTGKFLASSAARSFSAVINRQPNEPGPI